MSCLNRFPGYCADCGAYVAAGAGVYVKARIVTYCAEHAPGDAFTRLTEEARGHTATSIAARVASRARTVPSGYGRVRQSPSSRLR